MLWATRKAVLCSCLEKNCTFTTMDKFNSNLSLSGCESCRQNELLEQEYSSFILYLPESALWWGSLGVIRRKAPKLDVCDVNFDQIVWKQCSIMEIVQTAKKTI